MKIGYDGFRYWPHVGEVYGEKRNVAKSETSGRKYDNDPSKTVKRKRL